MAFGPPLPLKCKSSICIRNLVVALEVLYETLLFRYCVKWEISFVRYFKLETILIPYSVILVSILFPLKRFVNMGVPELSQECSNFLGYIVTYIVEKIYNCLIFSPLYGFFGLLLFLLKELA